MSALRVCKFRNEMFLIVLCFVLNNSKAAQCTKRSLIPVSYLQECCRGLLTLTVLYLGQCSQETPFYHCLLNLGIDLGEPTLVMSHEISSGKLQLAGFVVVLIHQLYYVEDVKRI